MYKVVDDNDNVLTIGSMDLCKKYVSSNSLLFESRILKLEDTITPPIGSIKPLDNINPHHYQQGKIECIDAIESATTGKTGFEGALVANIIKYIWRYEEKNGLEDVKKTQWYINKLIQAVQEREEKQ